LEVQSIQSPAGFVSIPLDGGESAITRPLAPGSYRLNVRSPAGLRLEKTAADGIRSNVPAELIDPPAPISVVITSGKTTSVVLHLRTADLADVTFDVGTLDVSAAVSEEHASRFASGSIEVFMTPTRVRDDDPTAPYAAPLAPTLSSGVLTTLSIRATGD